MIQNCILLIILSFLGATNLVAQSFTQILCQMEGENLPRQVSLVTADCGQPINYAVTTVSPSGTFGFITEPLPRQQFFYLYDGSRYFRIFLHAGNTIKVGWCSGKFSFVVPGNSRSLFREIQRMRSCNAGIALRVVYLKERHRITHPFLLFLIR